MVEKILDGKMILQKSACGVYLQMDSKLKTEVGTLARDGEKRIMRREMVQRTEAFGAMIMKLIAKI